jgi:hypothetical protein
MSDPIELQLLAYLLGELAEHERQALQQRLAADPALRAQLQRLRHTLQALDESCERFEPPAGLAQRACQHIRQLAHRPTSGAAVYRASESHLASSRLWTLRDILVAVLVLSACALLFFPAVAYSRFRARVLTCQNNLREVGMALRSYSHVHSGYFPDVPPEGREGYAGIYCPKLRSCGLLEEPRWVSCPSVAVRRPSPLHVPTLEEIRTASPQQLFEYVRSMGGDYGYTFGYEENGTYYRVRDRGRNNFAILADAPSPTLDGHPSRNHGRFGQNVLFESGHVTFLRTDADGSPLRSHLCNDRGSVAAGVHVNDSVIAPSHATPLGSARR